jgi:uncharacterized protein YdcH (DUF465 family)
MQNPWGTTIGIDEHAFRRNKQRGYRHFATIFVEYSHKRVREIVLRRSPGELLAEERLTNIPGRENVLNSKEAIRANVQIMRTFVSIRNLASTYKELEKRVLEVEEKSDKNYKLLLTALLQLKDQIEPTLKKSRKKIGLS